MSYLNKELKITYEGGRQEVFTTGTTIGELEYNDQNIIAVEVPEIVKEIGEYAFCDNNDLANIVLNEGLEIIGSQAFQHGVYTAVTIPSTVTYIGWNSFNTSDEQYDDHHTFTVTCLATTPPELQDEEGITFGEPELLSAIYVPVESVLAYQEAWRDYASKIYAIGQDYNYIFKKYMMPGDRTNVAKAINGRELDHPYAVLVSGDFYTEKGLCDKAQFVQDWYIKVTTPNSRKVALTPTEFVFTFSVAYNGQGLKTGEFGVDEFEAITEEREMMAEFYSFIPAGTALNLIDAGDGTEGLWHINSKGDYVYDGTEFSFEEGTDRFKITWQDDIPGDKGEICTGFVVRTTPHREPER